MKNPPYRVAKDPRAEDIKDVRHAHTAVVASLEWFERGAPGQFDETALDQLALAKRFIDGILSRRRP